MSGLSPPRVASWGAALVVALVTLYVALSTPRIGPDATRGLLAAEQRLAGRGNALTEIIIQDPGDLDVERHQTIGWWAPGQQQIVFGLRRIGLSRDAALRAAVTVSWLAGLAAWATLFWRSLRDTRVLSWLLVAFVLFRGSHGSAFQYTGGETLLWVAFPVVALANLWALGARGPAQLACAALSGLLAGSLVMLKYSGGVLGLGLGLVWLWSWCRRDLAARSVVAWGAGASAAMVVVASLGILTLMQGDTPATPFWSYPIAVVLAVGVFGPLAVLADALEIVMHASRRIAGGPLSDGAVGFLVSVLGALFALWAVVRARKFEERAPHRCETHRLAFQQAALVTITVSVVLIVIQLRGGILNWETRYHQYGAFLMMPFFAETLIASARSASRSLRVASAACLIVFFAMPAVYGGALIAARSARMTGVSLSASDAGAWAVGTPPDDVIDELEALPAFRAALLATPSISTAIAFPAKRVHLVMHSGQWRSERFSGRPAGGVALLLHPGVGETDAAVLRGSFTEIQRWTRVPLVSAPAAQLWLGS